MSNPDSFPLPTKPLTRVNLGQSVVGVKRSYTEKPPLNHFDPDPWLRASRTTPGMTYRTNEDRTPANPGPGQYQSYNHEMQDSHVVNNTPGVFRRQNYLTGAAVAGGALLLIFFSLWY